MVRRIVIAICGLAVVAAGIGGVVFLKQRHPSHAALKTYFSYTQAEQQPLASLNSQQVMTVDELYQADQQAFTLVKKYKLPPTTAAKMYAYVATAQHDAAALSHNASGKYAGTLAPVSEGVLCTFFANDCATIKHDTYDQYSQKLATIVVKKVTERIATDTPANRHYTIYEASALWDGKNPVTIDAGLWQPWVLPSVDDFQAPAPPEVNSAQDRAQLAAVQQAVAGITDQQKAAVLYWAGGAGTETPGGIWLGLADTALQAHTATFEKALMVRTTLTQTMADAFIACWHSKFTYWTVRPNMKDPTLKTIIPTPNFPSYVSGHSTVSAAAATVLASYFPADTDAWMKKAEEARDSRLWAGIHFPVDNEQGFILGQKIAQYAINKQPSS